MCRWCVFLCLYVSLFECVCFMSDLLCDVVWPVSCFCVGFLNGCVLFLIYCVLLYGLLFCVDVRCVCLNT